MMQPVPGTQRRLVNAMEASMELRARLEHASRQNVRMIESPPNEIMTRLLANQEALLAAVAQLFATVLPESPLAELEGNHGD